MLGDIFLINQDGLFALQKTSELSSSVSLAVIMLGDIFLINQDGPFALQNTSELSSSLLWLLSVFPFPVTAAPACKIMYLQTLCIYFVV